MRKMMLLLLLMSLWLGLLPGAQPAQAQPGSFESGSCDFDLGFLTMTQEMECGVLRVPLNYDAPNAESIALDVAILRSPNPDAAPDPLIIAQGGPGGSTIDLYTQLFALGLGDALLETRDVILFDQRGTLYSDPALMCPELLEAAIDTLDDDLSIEETERIELDATQRCYDRLLAEGVDPSAFDSVANAADVEALRQALGYEQYNFYGVSYGTMLAQHLLRDHPGALRTVIMDAIVPLSINFIPELGVNVQNALDNFFAACAADAPCSSTYPDLEATFYRTIEQLDAEPLLFPIVDPESGESYDALVNDYAFVNIIALLLYQTDIIPQLPRLITQLSQGDPGILPLILPQVVLDDSFSQGMHLSVICAEDADYVPTELSTTNVHPLLHEALDDSIYLEFCEVWKVEPLDSYVDELVASDLPVLLLSGQFDPVTPPPWAELLSTVYPNSYRYVFPGMGHGAFLSGEACADEIVLAFLENPSQPPPDSCISAMAPRFITGSETITLQPFEDSELGLQGLAPEGWEEILPGAWQDPGNIAVGLTYQVVPGVPASMLLSLLAGQLGISQDLMEVVESQEHNGITWSLYYFEAQGSQIDMAIGEHGDSLLLLLLQSTLADRPQLYEQVFLPMVESMRFVE